MKEKTVLVVEDNELNMKLIVSYLTLNHFRVMMAQDAECAIEMVRENPPDLILMDIQLPGMNGLEAARIIVHDEKIKHIPIVALSAYAMESDKQKALDAGCCGYLTKPISQKDLIKQIQKIILTQEPSQPNYCEARRSPRILIVDDNDLNLKILKAKLPNDQYEIHTASGGAECLQLVPTLLPDLILLDVMMPEINGYEVTWRLKNDPKTSHIPVILVTALDDPNDKAKGLEAGADEFLTKPVNKSELIARVQSMVRLKKYYEQLVLRMQSEEQVEMMDTDFVSQESWHSPQKVLLIDDNPNDIKLIKDYLAEYPCELSIADSGEKALSLILNESVDVVLLDVVLPGMDGYELCRCIKSNDSTRDIQVVIITCLTDLESKLMGIEHGADDFLIKPVNKKELSARIKSLLRKKNYLDQIRHRYKIALNSAITDGLTELYNQAYFAKFFDLEIKRALRQKYTTALLMVDVDDFKLYNDNLGHVAGDMLIREVAQVIKWNAREIDLVARYGGEEFAVVLPYASKKEASLVAQRILKAVRSHSYTNKNIAQLKQLTISVGIALFPTDANTPQSIIKKADEMLYRAKESGKNCVQIYGCPSILH